MAKHAAQPERPVAVGLAARELAGLLVGVVVGV